MTTIRVFLADPHTLFREGVKRLLAAAGDREVSFEVVGEAGDGHEAVERATRAKPDVVLLDVGLPRLNGADATRAILDAVPAAKVVVVSIYATPEYVFRALEAGATGYLLKDCEPKDLERAIELAHEGLPFFSPVVAKALVEGFVAKQRADQPPGPYELLTQREREILQLIAEGHRNREVSKMLDLSIKTVEVHRAHIMEKLNARSLADLVHLAIGRGIVRA